MAMRGISRFGLLLVILAAGIWVGNAAEDTNPVYNPCGDTRVQKLDGFTLGIVFNSNESFYYNNHTQLSPCDRRLRLYSGKIAAFRPRVDEISLLTINETDYNTGSADNGYMVAYAGSRFGARSKPHLVSNDKHTVTSFTLVLEFRRGRLINMLWKNDDCKSCDNNSNNGFVCLRTGDCAIANNNCRQKGGKVDCSLGITVAFSGTDKNDVVLNTWYQVGRLHQYSLFNLYSSLKGSIWNQLFF